jgi:Rieske Fe-S protein
MADRSSPRPPDHPLPGAFDGETVTRRRLMTTGANLAGAVAAAAIVLPVIGFAAGPVFRRLPVTWQPIGAADAFPTDTFVARVIELAPGAGQAGKGTVFVRRRNRRLDTEPADRWNQFIVVTSRCSHVGCPVAFQEPASAFVCPCHGGVYDLRGLRIGGPPPRPLDRFDVVKRGEQLYVMVKPA